MTPLFSILPKSLLNHALSWGRMQKIDQVGALNFSHSTFFIVFTSVVSFNIEFKIADKTTKLEVH